MCKCIHSFIVCRCMYGIRRRVFISLFVWIYRPSVNALCLFFFFFHCNCIYCCHHNNHYSLCCIKKWNMQFVRPTLTHQNHVSPNRQINIFICMYAFYQIWAFGTTATDLSVRLRCQTNIHLRQWMCWVSLLSTVLQSSCQTEPNLFEHSLCAHTNFIDFSRRVESVWVFLNRIHICKFVNNKKFSFLASSNFRGNFDVIFPPSRMNFRDFFFV